MSAEGNSDTSQLLKQWHSGDPDGLEALLKAHLPWIRNQVRKRLGPVLRRKGETNDYVQNAMIQFLKYGPRFSISRGRQFRALLLCIVENSLRNQHDWFTARRRAIARERPLPSDTVLYLDPPCDTVSTPSKVVDRIEKEAWIRFGMEFLTDSDREILVLRHWDKQTFKEIGERLEVSDIAARLRHNRIMKRLGDTVWALSSGKLHKVVKGLHQKEKSHDTPRKPGP